LALVKLERLAAFGLPLTFYLVVGALLAFKYHSWFGDAQARLANAYYVLYSRDPHLAAIGFVWNPGTSLAEIPILLLKPWFPALSAETFGAVIVSALAMAGGGYQIYRFAEERGVRRLVRWALLVAFVANPMIFFFGANGMSEALFIFTLTAAARYMARWLRSGTLSALVAGGVAIGLAYMVRNEAVAAAGITAVVVALVSFRRANGAWRSKLLAGLTDSVIFAGPFLLAFVGWALVSWVIVGHPFEQYASAYGTSSQLKLLGGTTDPGARFSWVVHALFWLTPLLPILIWLAVRGARRQRDNAVVAVFAVLGGVVLFEVVAYTLGQISWALRYLIYALPLAAMLAVCIARPEPLDGPDVRRGRWTLIVGRKTFLIRNGVSSALAVILLVVGCLASANALVYSKYDRVDQQLLNFVLWPSSRAAHANPFRTNWVSVKQEAEKLDAMHLGRGAIMVDNFNFCIPNLILQSKHPKQFAIPNDEDFIEKMGAPYQSGVRYFLVPAPTQFGVLDALNREWPTLYANGSGLADLVGTIKMSGCLPFRMYKLTPTAA
jgi:hypothetical protein